MSIREWFAERRRLRAQRCANVESLAKRGIVVRRYANAFSECADACVFCGEDMRWLGMSELLSTPSGESFTRIVRCGYGCIRCGYYHPHVCGRYTDPGKAVPFAKWTPEPER